MGSRDRPSREVKKKPKAGDTKPKLQPFLEVPQNVEIIKPRRKPRTETPSSGGGSSSEEEG